MTGKVVGDEHLIPATSDSPQGQPTSSNQQEVKDDHTEFQEALALLNDKGPSEKAEAAEEPKGEDEPQESGSVTRGWAAVKAQEKKLRQEREALKRDKQELSKLREEVENLKTGQVDYQGKLKSDPFGTLKEAGFDFEDLARRFLADDVTPAQAPAAPQQQQQQGGELSEVKQQLAELRQLLTQKEQRQVIDDYKSGLERTMAGEKYELLRGYFGDPVAEGIQFAAQHAQETGETLTPEQVCDTLQDIWREQLSSMKSSAAIRQALGLEESPATQETQEAASRSKAPKVISNQHSQTPTKPKGPMPPMSDEEELEAAARLINNDDWARLAEF